MRDVWISIAIFGICSFGFGFLLAIWHLTRKEQKKQDAYYAECMRDFYRAGTDEEQTKDAPGF